MNKVLQFLVDRSLVVNLVSIFLLGIGIYAAVSINREAFPNVNMDVLLIEVHYPGASPKELEQLVVTPIEQELRLLSGIDKMVSMSFPGSARISLELDPDASNRDQIANDVTLAVNRAKLPRDLPDDPIVTEIDGSVFPIVRLAIQAPMDDLQLKRLGDKIKDDLLNVPGVGQVVVFGDRKSEIRVTVDPKRMRQERVSVDEIARALQAWNLNVPGGDIDTPKGQKVVRVVGEFEDAKDASQLVLRATEGGSALRLGDVAEVKESLIKPQTLYSVGGKPGFSMLILKKSGHDIIDTIDQIKEYAKTIPELYGKDIKYSFFQDFSRFVKLRLGVLTNNGMVGLVLVFVSLLLFLRLSVALTTTLGLPIIFFSGLFILYISGISLNMISMMGFIMVLGMLVDDAIIVGENITYYMEQGLSPHKAAVKGAHDLLGPVTTTIMTTVAAFIPMMFVSGMIGKFIIAIPVVVITLLIISWLQSFLVLPSHAAGFTNPNKHPPERAWLVALDKTYEWFLVRAVRWRWTTIFVSFSVLIGSLMLTKALPPFQLFPAAGVEEFVVKVTAPAGTDLLSMHEKLKQIDAEIHKRASKYMEATVLKSGDISLDQMDPLIQRGSRYAQLRAIYTPAVGRPHHDALVEMRRLAKEIPPLFPDLTMNFSEIRPGPPVGHPLQAEISGHNDDERKLAANRLIEYLSTIKGVYNIESGLKPGDDELKVRLNRRLATYAGIDLATASRHIRAASGGLVVSTVRRNTEEIDVTLRFPDDRKDQLSILKNVLIPNNRDGLVPLYKIAEFVETPGFTTLRHKDGIRVINVVADVDANIISSTQLNRQVRAHQAEWLGDLSSKIHVNYGGEEEKNQESFDSLVAAFLFALIGIFFILAIQFNRLSYPILVMLAIPFGMVGIIISFLVHSWLWKPMPLSFMSMLGMVALTGVVVNSSLVLLVFIQRARHAGMAMEEAIIQAGRRRLRAVLLTATTTVVGLLPTAYGWGGMDPFVAPMALALSWGLMFATGVTLITIPATLAAAHDVKYAIKHHILKHPKPESSAVTTENSAPSGGVEASEGEKDKDTSPKEEVTRKQLRSETV